MIQEDPGDRSQSRENDKRSNKLKMDSRSLNQGEATEDTTVQLLYHNAQIGKDRSRTNKVSRHQTESVESQNQMRTDFSPSFSKGSVESSTQEIGLKKVVKIPKGAKALFSNYQDINVHRSHQTLRQQKMLQTKIDYILQKCEALKDKEPGALKV